jgi:hypothetical protein
MKAILCALALALAAGPAAAAAGGGAPAGPAPAARLFVTSDRCLACHNGLTGPEGQDLSIGSEWSASMMAHSAKDPYWQASVRRETLDHPQAAAAIQDECSACHMPMTRYLAKVHGRRGEVFANLPARPAAPAPARRLLLAWDSVSCSMCHQIRPDKLGTEASFTAGFEVDRTTPLGRRPAFGPFEVDAGRRRVMRSAARLEPTQGKHQQQSALCGSCHTLYTHARGPGGEVVGKLPEQVPYLEWKHSDYYQSQSCQSCHMPAQAQPMPITSVLGQDRPRFSRHSFRGGNFFMLGLLERHSQKLGVTARPADLAASRQRTQSHLQSLAAELAVTRAEVAGASLRAEVRVTNLAGHKLPTAYPSRRAWLRLTVTDAAGREVFSSGGLRPDGSIAGNDNDADPRRYEPHHREITSPEEVQIYEAIMAGPDGEVTTGLIRAVRFVKDTRVLPAGFDKASAHQDIAVQGRAAEDADFTGGGDTVRYRAAVDPDRGPFTVKAELWYQPIAFRWAQNLRRQSAPEIERFVGYYDAAGRGSALLLAQDSRRAP